MNPVTLFILFQEFVWPVLGPILFLVVFFKLRRIGKRLDRRL